MDNQVLIPGSIKRCQHNCQVLLGLIDEEFRVVSDDGAVIMVLGKGWHVAKVCPRRKLELMLV